MLYYFINTARKVWQKLWAKLP